MVYGAALEKRSPIISERGFESHPLRGEVLEWPNRHAWRACVGFSRPWVRIPPSPPAGIFQVNVSHLASLRG